MKRILGMFVLTFSAFTFAFGECSEADRKAFEAFDRSWSERANLPVRHFQKTAKPCSSICKSSARHLRFGAIGTNSRCNKM